MTKTATTPKHPAKFSAAVIVAIIKITRRRIKSGEGVLDCYGGTGRIHDLADQMGWKSVAVEIEPEWADMHPRTKLGDSTKLTKMVWLKKWKTRFGIAAVITSVCYGNRMSDHHNAKETCKLCDGSGSVEVDEQEAIHTEGVVFEDRIIDGERHVFRECVRCGGKGRNKYKRNTYKHTLDRRDPETGDVLDLDENNTGTMPFKDGPCRYREVHQRVWEEVAALRPRWIILNVSDFYAGKNPDGSPHRMLVTQWHLDTLDGLGYHEVERIEVETPRNKHGENRDLRVEHEYVIALRRR